MTKVNFVRKAFPSGAYVFNAWLRDPQVGEYLAEVMVFDDNKRSAKSAAVRMLREEEQTNRK